MKLQQIVRSQIVRRIFLPSLVTLGIIWLLFLHSSLTLPEIDLLKIENPTMTAFMQRYDGKAPLQYRFVPYPEISSYLKRAVVIAEDSSFFEHSGFDWKAIQKAAEKNWEEKEFVRGGSTITQQLAKNLYLSPSKNPFRKLKEIIITLELERKLSKQRILELYLNVVEWGEGIYGAEAAAQYYFNTKASNLSPYQACWLAAILPKPRYFQTHHNGPFIQRKTAMILGRMGI
ncbi:MAG: monofunctional biosynthetic peptidoglycan transglycosylase [Deltaproteobacteria bacterium]|nr:monofunctional biosynthetic peptidoglycan transglycosylase [Deltaproteobacteria bacterium]